MLTHVTFVDLNMQDERGESTSTDDSQSPAVQAERNEMQRLIREGLNRLSERDATVLSLYYVEELDYMEIGSVLGVSESRVCQLHTRALSRLRAELDVEAEV